MPISDYEALLFSHLIYVLVFKRIMLLFFSEILELTLTPLKFFLFNAIFNSNTVFICSLFKIGSLFRCSVIAES